MERIITVRNHKTPRSSGFLGCVLMKEQYGPGRAGLWSKEAVLETQHLCHTYLSVLSFNVRLASA